MANRSVLRRHALHHTEIVNPESVHRSEKGFSWCDPKGLKKIEGTRANDWRPSVGVFVSAPQTPEDLLRTNCPDCAKRWGKVSLDTCGAEVLVEKIEPYSDYVKSTYRISVDGVARGYISIQNGWGEKWRIHRLAHDRQSHAMFTHNDEPVGHTLDDNMICSIHRSSLDGLASLFPPLIEAGKLPTAEESIAADRRRAEERAHQRAESDARNADATLRREEERRERVERQTLAREAVKAVSDRADRLGLSNAETIGLLEALKFIG